MNNVNSGDKDNNTQTYANIVKQSENNVKNKLSFRPTIMNEDGSEFVVFDE